MKHEEDWQLYPSQLKDEFALFAVDLGAADVAPIPGISQMNWLRVGFTTTREDGMPDENEAAQLAEVEDWWTERMQDDGGVHLGRMTCAGRREFFAYTKNDMGDDLVAEARRLFGERYDFEGNTRPDPAWEVYSGFLYPDELALRRIANFKVVTQLRHSGDLAHIVRPVDHHINFADETTRSAYTDELVEAGFEVVSTAFDEDDNDLPYALHVRSNHGTDLATVDSVVLPLWLRAREIGGSYDGWGSPVMAEEP